ncbi:MAG: HAMP domain-containing histidine kinase [Treponema sp.]|jgi:signal transduction histidine kinase|nr:HAMP domain-containing histidine kinase [Treponema sp.]
MKIRTQARLLVAGILLAPLLIFLTNIVYRQFFVERDVPGLPAYEEVFALTNEYISVQDWETLTRIIAYSRNLGDFAVLNDDFFVLYSTLPEFNTGDFASQESIFSLVTGEKQLSNIFFSSRNLTDSRVFILNKALIQPARPRLYPFFFTIFIFIILLTVFAICMSIVIAKTITNSIQVLEDATRRIAKGELDLQIDVKGSNEIISLTNSLNKMRNALKEEELRRSRFIMGISHDLKTPLALIKGYAEAIEDGVTEDPVSRSNAAEIITAKADQLDGMINDLINYVRMETGEWREKLNDISITIFLKNFAKTMSMDVELMQHEFIADINLPENLSVLMDERLMVRALENLIHNSVRHTPAGSIIRFTAALTENTVELVISDNGPGIDRETLPHVFEPLYRSSSSRREQGMGLGLAVVKWVADYHRWQISVSSEKGTSFTITIPL